MTAEGSYPKNKGDIFYASEANLIKIDMQTTLEQEMDYLVYAQGASKTPIDKCYVVSDILVSGDKDGYLNTIDITNTDVLCCAGTYYNNGLTIYDTFFDCSRSTTKWCDTCTLPTGTAGYVCECSGTPNNMEIYACSSNSNTAVVVSYTKLLDTTSGNVCFKLTGALGSPTSASTNCSIYTLKIGGVIVDTCSKPEFVTSCSISGCFELCRINAGCVDVYKNGTCICRAVTATDTVYVCNTAYGYTSPVRTADARVCIYEIGNKQGGALNVYTNCCDFGSVVKGVYAVVDGCIPTNTCVTFDVLKASDCSVLSSGNAINSNAKLTGNDCNIKVRYNLCSTTYGSCVKMTKYAYGVVY